MTMTSRERVLAAVNRQTPDRTPRDFWAETPTMNRLYAHLGHRDEQRLLDDLGIDIARVEAVGPPEQTLPGGVIRNLWGEQYVHNATEWGPMREDVPGALAGAICEADLEAFPWPTPDCFDYSGLPAACDRAGDRAILYGFADVWQRPGLVRGWEAFFLDMAERPDWCRALSQRFADFYVEDYTRAQEAAGGRIDLFLLISDLGSQNGPLISLPMFRRMVAPYLKRVIDRIHHLGARVMFHSCGGIAPFIPDLIELGVDILDPIQPVGPDMQPAALKARYGDRLCFHGGIDMQRLLPLGSPEEVAAEARRYCETLGAGGGYILAPAHLFQPDVPAANILAMYGLPAR